MRWRRCFRRCQCNSGGIRDRGRVRNRRSERGCVGLRRRSGIRWRLGCRRRDVAAAEVIYDRAAGVGVPQADVAAAGVRRPLGHADRPEG